jgi:hypothetical protein
MALDLRRCGIGNIVLQAAAHHATGGKIIVHDNPHELGILDLTLFDITDDASLADPKLNPGFCNLNTLRLACEHELLQKVVKPRDDVPDVSGVQAGFCFRVKKRELDGDSDDFMNDRAIAAMLAESMKYSKVLAVGNDEDILNKFANFHPDAIVIPPTHVETRNHDDHVVQWHALSKCPVVYHGIMSTDRKGLTSTFAPLAAAYGGIHPDSGKLIGIDNNGLFKFGKVYTWCGV